MAASVENTAVATYQAVVNAITTSRLTGIPPAVVAFAKAAQQQHRDHASAFNGMLIAAGHPPVTVADEVLQPAFVQSVNQVRNYVDFARLARTLENVAAATYQDGVNRLADRKAVTALAKIQPVEREHAAVLSFLIGEYPVADTYSSTSKKGEEARPVSDFRG
jgi:hypothetical protein